MAIFKQGHNWMWFKALTAEMDYFWWQKALFDFSAPKFDPSTFAYESNSVCSKRPTKIGSFPV